MSEGKASKYTQRLTYLKNQYNQGWRDQQQDVSSYMLPNRGFFVDQGQIPNEGDQTNSQIIDSEATRAIMIFAAGMQGGLTSPSRPWLRLKMGDPDLSKFGPVKEWLSNVEKVLYAAYSQSNFYQAIYTDYIELIGFCTSCLYQESGINTVLNFKNQTAGSYYIQDNSMGIVDTVYRTIQMIAKNMMERFGDANRQPIKEAAKKNPYQFFKVAQAVQPNNERDIALIDGENKVYESVYFEPGESDNILLKSGFEENPFHVARYSLSGGDVYGRGPGFDEMPNTKQLQEMQRTTYIALHKEIDPPIVAPSSMIDNMDDLPGGITPWDGGEKPEKLYDVKLNISQTEGKIESLQQKIKEGFFNDIFLMISQSPGVQPLNDAELFARKEEQFTMLGPIIDRTIFEKLDPIVERSLGILFRGGFLPPAPEEIQGQQLDIEYISLLAQAQKSIGSTSLKQFGGYVAELASLNPNALDKLNIDEAINEFGDMVGVSPTVINSDDEVAEIREQRALQQQQLLEQQQTQEMVQGAKTLADTDTGSKNALTDIAGAV